MSFMDSIIICIQNNLELAILLATWGEPERARALVAIYINTLNIV